MSQVREAPPVEVYDTFRQEAPNILRVPLDLLAQSDCGWRDDDSAKVEPSALLFRELYFGQVRCQDGKIRPSFVEQAPDIALHGLRQAYIGLEVLPGALSSEGSTPSSLTKDPLLICRILATADVGLSLVDRRHVDPVWNHGPKDNHEHLPFHQQHPRLGALLALSVMQRLGHRVMKDTGAMLMPSCIGRHHQVQPGQHAYGQEWDDVIRMYSDSGMAMPSEEQRIETDTILVIQTLFDGCDDIMTRSGIQNLSQPERLLRFTDKFADVVFDFARSDRDESRASDDPKEMAVILRALTRLCLLHEITGNPNVWDDLYGAKITA